MQFEALLPSVGRCCHRFWQYGGELSSLCLSRLGLQGRCPWGRAFMRLAWYCFLSLMLHGMLSAAGRVPHFFVQVTQVPSCCCQGWAALAGAGLSIGSVQ